MSIAELTARMIAYSKANLHDIDHFLRVWAYAGTIGRLEGLDAQTQYVLEAAALLHDIACPLCREKYGNTNGKLQEREGMVLAEDFLRQTDLPEEVRARIVFLVGHHHSFTDVDGIDWQILLEADFLVNCDESGYSASQCRAFRERVFRTPSGLRLLASMYPEHLSE